MANLNDAIYAVTQSLKKEYSNLRQSMLVDIHELATLSPDPYALLYAV